MLIASERHAPADLALWAELEEADRLNGERLLKSGKIERSIEAIRGFSKDGPCYCSVSWGKDSVVLAHLACQAQSRWGLSFPLVWLTYGQATNPECYSVRDAFRSFHDFTYIQIDVGESEAMRDDFRPAVRATGTDRYILGIRAEESGVRRISLRRLGIATVHACRPLAWWTAQDVFGYLAIQGLPVHPNYAMLGGGRWPRGYLRTASIGGERGVENGRRDWEREYYGDVLRRLEAGRLT